MILFIQNSRKCKPIYMDKKQFVFAQELTGLGECRKDRQGLQKDTRKLESDGYIQ